MGIAKDIAKKLARHAIDRGLDAAFAEPRLKVGDKLVTSGAKRLKNFKRGKRPRRKK